MKAFAKILILVENKRATITLASLRHQYSQVLPLACQHTFMVAIVLPLVLIVPY